MTERTTEAPANELGTILHATLQHSITRYLGPLAHYSFKDPNCDTSNEAYRGWTMFLSGTKDSDALSVRLTNDRDINVTYQGTKDDISAAINADKTTPTADQILQGINEDAQRRSDSFSKWAEGQVAQTTAAVSTTIQS